MQIILSEKADIKNIIKKVNKDRAPVAVVDDSGMSAVIISFEDFDAINETIYLFSSKANVAWLCESVKELETNKLLTFTMEELEKMAYD